MNINNMVKQVQKVQEQMSRVQEELADKTVEASSGGDMVRVVANGKQEIVTVQISPEAVDPKDISMLEDLVAAAANQALRLSKTLMQEELAKITGGLRIPGMNL